MSLLTQEELILLQSDSKYKNYVSSIEKSLKNFESSSEWADLISSLGKLKKCIQSFPKYQYIPKRVNVCKRLAQCLHPALPSGVHLKALEVYTCIFQNIGPDNLSKDLFLYSGGLFPLLANAALSVKPILLNLYETYFLPLKKSLRPCLTGLLIALLPGLEEGSDFFQKSFNLIKNICHAQSDNYSNTTNISNYIADDKYFYTCLWSAVISQSSIRFPAILFVQNNYEAKKKASNLNKDELYLIGNSIDLMINAFCCCLQDPNPLVQRHVLDLISSCLPMDTKHVTKGDKIQLIIVVIHVVLRRDMSLNRRIYSWLMGNVSNSDDSKLKNKKNNDEYFTTHSKSLLIQAIKMLLNKKESSSILYLLNDEIPINLNSGSTILGQSVSSSQTSSSTNTTLKLLKIVSNLVERQEIGQSIIDDILLDLLFYVYKEYSNLNNGSVNLGIQHYLNMKKASSNFQHVQQQQQQQQNLKESNELKKATCNFLFQSFQVYFIWEFCANKFELICKNYSNFNFGNSLQSASSHTITSENSISYVNPGQLCDLYEFILELLANSDMYNEIQTEHLPLMLKRIIQTLNNYCENMSNLDLSKSLYLCLKILNKVVPKIVVPDSSSNQQSTTNKTRRLSVKTSKPIENNDREENIEEIIKDVLNDIITNVENPDLLLDTTEIHPCTKTTEPNEPDDKLIIEQCLNSLKKLCHTFIRSHLYQDTQQDFLDKSFKSLFSLKNKSFISNDDGYQSDSSDLNNLTLMKLKSNSLQYLQSYQILNKLLIKLLFFPREQIELNNSNQIDDSPETLLATFEEWLKDLFVISTCSQMHNHKLLFEFQSISLNTLIELIHLSESVNSHFTPKKTQSDPKCLLQTIFNKKQIEFIFNQSRFGYLTAQMLWSHLAPCPNQLDPYANCTDKRASILFCLLHELLPNNLCEEIIIKNFLIPQNFNLNSDIYTTSSLNKKIDSFKRFTRLWHWSRELNTSSDLDDLEELSVSTIKYGKLTKTFERFLLILFDHLTKEDTPRSLNKIIQDWLTSCITDYNDLARLIDILLVSLVHPSTARVSVQFFINNILNTGNSKSTNFSDVDDSANSSFESKVFAISNEDGNVKYHVNNETVIKPINQQQQQQQLFMLTSLEQSTQSNKPLKNTNIELPLSILNPSLNSGISLRINPFLGDDETEDESNSKNSKLLENYKAIKMKQKNPSPLPSPNISPSLPSISPNPADVSIPSINLEQKSNRNSLETNQSEYLSDEDEELDEDLDDDDEDYNFSDEDFREDTDLESQNTDVTLLSERSKKFRNSLGNYKKNRKIKIKDRLKKSSSSTLINERTSKSAEKLTGTQQPILIKNKDLIVDLQNQLDANFSHLLIYINCNNIQTIQQGNCVLVASKFSNTSYDHVKVLFLLKCIEQLLIKCRHEFLNSITQTCISSHNLVHSVHNEKLLDLLMKHLRSIYGENFYLSSSNVPNLSLNQMTYLEAVTLILLFYIRSYYPPSKFLLKNGNEQLKISKSNSINSINSDNGINIGNDDVDNLLQFEENRNIQIYCLKILSKLFKELNILITQSNKPIHKNVLDYLDKLKIQKTFLHLLNSTIQQSTPNSLPNLLLQINNFNNLKQNQYSYVSELLNCFENLIDLERVLNDYNQSVKFLKSGLLTSASQQKISDTEDDFLLTLVQKKSPQTNSNKYIPNQAIFNQSMFVSSILYYLKNMSLVEYHLDILKLIRNTLSSSGSNLKSISTYIIEQLCRNLLYITNGGMATSGSSSGNYIQPIISYMSQVSMSINIPDIIINMIKQLSFLLNYCLTNRENSSLMVFNLGGELNADVQLKLFRQFQADNELNLLHARESLIHLFPSILSSMAQVWQRCNLLLNSSNVVYSLNDFNGISNVNQMQCTWILGHPAIIKQCITDLLNPIAQYHSVQFMNAIGTVWGERRKKSKVYQEHRVIIELIRSLKAFSLPVIIQNISDILKQTNSNSNKDKKKSPLNIWLLQFLHTYLDYYIASAKPRTNTGTKSLIPQTDILNNNELATCLCNFFKENLSNSTTSNFAPACYFQLFRILHDSVNNIAVLVEDKKFSKDLQEATHKLFELCNSIVASSLQQTTWLRKNFAVKLNPQPDSKSQSTSQLNPQINGTSSNQNQSLNTTSSSSLQTSANLNNTIGNSVLNESINSSTSNKANTTSITSGVGTSMTSSSTYATSIQTSTPHPQSHFSDIENEMTSNLSDHGSNLNSIDHLNGFVGDLNDSNNNLAYSLQALNILAEYLAKTLDIVYKSDEKDRLVIPILMSLMSNLWPYLKTHSVANKNNFRAASNLLMTLTVYPYTRKTWKKEVFEMLFDNLYFHVDSATLEYSKTIIDNLISNDRAMFKDVLTRVTYQQSGGLFTSKEQESEQKAQLLKRLAFVIFSSEKDQYQKNMPEIQECIAHVLKLVQSANLYSTLFLLFRILLLRISSRHLIALWPTIISELILILLQIEQDLSEDYELNIKIKRNGTKYSNLDHIASQMTTQSWNNGKLQIYLSACKLIDLILTLPSTLTPQFQLYKWSFINTEDALNLKQKDQFVPYLTKINNLLKNKFPINNSNKVTNLKSNLSGPLIRHKTISSLVDLKPFFEQVTTHQFVHSSNQTHSISNQQLQSQSLLATTNLKLFEANVHEDFLEGWIQ
ncbi:unnamed protein product [Brachionus calyciflorus]|uniref:Uncharacterized protein n=1 Tax=Brachionus calyciflorus TaxID=104777 RepID=A0A813R6V4_9BILA|nr:unnamed protein product [Brachionus calyciflorus]